MILAVLSLALASPPQALPAAPFLVPPPSPSQTPEADLRDDEFVDAGLLWKPVCSDVQATTDADLRSIAAAVEAQRGRAVVPVTSSQRLTSGLDIQFVVPSGLSAQQLAAIAAAEAYVEPFFADPITVTIDFDFQSIMNPNILGGTASEIGFKNLSGVRNRLVADMDGNDAVQPYLPSDFVCLALSRIAMLGHAVSLPSLGLTFSGQILNPWKQKKLYFTAANWKAIGGTASFAADAYIRFNSNVTWDYDPSNGVVGTSFRDVLIHEITHALGFASAADRSGLFGKLMILDAFRFPVDDGTTDANPDTFAEFTVRTRSLNLNVAENTDLITAEYEMEDGDPYQHGHFKQQSPRIGLMQPALPPETTYWPNYYTAADLDVLDAIGYDR